MTRSSVSEAVSQREADPGTHAQRGPVPILLDLPPAAHGAWVRLHDGIEKELGAGGAEQVVCWHLQEIRRLFAELDTPPALAAAIRLDNWLLHEARTTGDVRIPTTRIYQYGPACVRDSRELKATRATLTERARARLETRGRRRYVVVNRALLRG